MMTAKRGAVHEHRVISLGVPRGTGPSGPSAGPSAPALAAGDDAPPLALPASHFAVALIALVGGALALLAQAPQVVQLQFFAPRFLASVHLFTLGWITTSILGALYQFLPVAVGVPIRSERAGYLGLALHASGLTLFVLGLVSSSPDVFRAGAILVSLGLLVFVVNLGLTLARAEKRDVTFWALALADLFLVATVVLGWLVAWNLHGGRLLGAERFTYLAVHVHVALAGWVLLVMVGVAHRLLPMFLLSHGASEWPARISVGLLASGSGLLLLPLGTPGHAGAAVLIASGVCAFLVRAAAVYRHRRRRALDPGMRLAYGALLSLAAATLAGPFALAQGFGAPRALVTYGLLAIVGAISTFIAGHYYKIVPFLVWYHRFGPLVGERPVPKVADLFSARVAAFAVAAFVLGTWTMTAGVALSSAAAMRVGASMFAAGVLVEAAQMIDIARRKPA
ncbi:MAG: cbb3-type cytochrome c oxidase subunit I [Sandaracinaceae bacterium]|nr:cbb3-type cytochrome c oxidase subunit I [Sandaracinaceae bacterium]